MNLCTECKQDFTSVALFDRHRVGVHAYTYAEGLYMDPEREDGRRCLGPDEMQDKGWTQTDDGAWQDPVKVAAARAAFRPA